MQDGLDALGWVAVLKPATVGVPAYRDEARDYAELSVLTAALRPAVRPAQAARLAELVHRAVPYPVVLVLAHGAAGRGGATLSLAHKRRSQAEPGAVVAELPGASAALGGAHAAMPDEAADGGGAERAFLAALALGAAPAADLFALYDRWIACATALGAARVTGRWSVPATPAAADARRRGLDEHARLRREAAALRAAAGRERQLAQRVAMNLDLHRLDARLTELARTI